MMGEIAFIGVIMVIDLLAGCIEWGDKSNNTQNWRLTLASSKVRALLVCYSHDVFGEHLYDGANTRRHSGADSRIVER